MIGSMYEFAVPKAIAILKNVLSVVLDAMSRHGKITEFASVG